MIKSLALLLLFTAPACAQLVPAHSLVFYPPIDSLAIKLDTNSSGGRLWWLPKTDGLAKQVLTSTGIDPDTLYWQTISTTHADSATYADTVLNPLPYIQNWELWGAPQTASFQIATNNATGSQITNSTTSTGYPNTQALNIQQDGFRSDTNKALQVVSRNSDTLNIGEQITTVGTHGNIGIQFEDSNYNANFNYDERGTAGNWRIDSKGNFTTNNSISSGVSNTTFGSLALFSGTSAGDVKLEANGSQSGEYIFSFPLGGGTSGQVLKSTGLGVTAWANPSSLITDYVKTDPATTADNTIVPSADIVELTVRGNGTQSQNLMDVTDAGATIDYFSVLTNEIQTQTSHLDLAGPSFSSEIEMIDSSLSFTGYLVPHTQTAPHVWALPDSSGTIALTSSIPSVPTPANPTAHVSGSAVNGTAATWMRSDAAPALANTTVTAGSYTNTNLTVDAQGRITAASNGSGGFSNPMTTLGDIIRGGTSGAPTRLAGNTHNYVEALTSTASSGVAQAPAWNTIMGTDYAVSSNWFAGGAGVATITGIENTAIGQTALSSGGSFTQNTAIGYDALGSNTGSENTAIGQAALSAVSGNANTAIGQDALTALGFGSNNTAIGQASNSGNLGNSGNTTIGASAGSPIGDNNTTIGYNTASVSGSYDVLIGVDAAKGDPSSPNIFSNTLVIGGNNTTGEGITDMYAGDGRFSTSGSNPDNFTLHGTTGNGTDIRGATLGLAGGVASGAGKSGPIILESALATTSGTTSQTLYTIHTFDTGGEILSEQAITVAANAGTLSGQAEFYEVPSNGGVPVALTAPAGTIGRIIYVENKDATALTTGLIVAAASVYKFIYDGSAWKHIQ